MNDQRTAIDLKQIDGIRFHCKHCGSTREYGIFQQIEDVNCPDCGQDATNELHVAELNKILKALSQIEGTSLLQRTELIVR